MQLERLRRGGSEVEAKKVWEELGRREEYDQNMLHSALKEQVKIRKNKNIRSIKRLDK